MCPCVNNIAHAASRGDLSHGRDELFYYTLMTSRLFWFSDSVNLRDAKSRDCRLHRRRWGLAVCLSSATLTDASLIFTIYHFADVDLYVSLIFQLLILFVRSCVVRPQFVFLSPSCACKVNAACSFTISLIMRPSHCETTLRIVPVCLSVRLSGACS